MNSIRAYCIVKIIASQGIAKATALYGRDACNQARFTLRASIARKQAAHARAQGADLKHRARFLAACNQGMDPCLTQRVRLCERDSKRHYRDALKYDCKAYRAGIEAEFHGALDGDRRAAMQRDRFAHFANA